MWAYNEATGTTGLYTVTAVLVHDDPVEVRLRVGGEQITTTPEHPFFTLERGWVDAGDLWRGAHIRRADGSFTLLQDLAIDARPRRMYNLTVAQAHTFFVGAQRVLVHNAKKCRSEFFERYGSEDEANATRDARGLVLRPGHERQPKWIGEVDVVEPGNLGKSKNYTHRMTFETQPDTRQWLKQFETKADNEPGRYEIPANMVDEFNQRVISVITGPWRVDPRTGRR